jgi:hypothetical protein
MMRKNLKKFILYLQATDGIQYTVSPAPILINTVDSEIIYNFEVDVNQSTQIRIQITGRNDESHIQIKKMILSDFTITDLNSVSFLQTDSGEIRRNHGYIDSVGTFVIKLHTNAVSLNYLNYLLSLTK